MLETKAYQLKANTLMPTMGPNQCQTNDQNDFAVKLNVVFVIYDSTPITHSIVSHCIVIIFAIHM